MELVILFLGGMFGVMGFKMISYRPKYETEKTTKGHTIKFLDYNESRKYKRYKIYGRLMFSLGIVFLGIGILFELLANR